MDGAMWFRSSDFGDNKDRLVVRANGQCTDFAWDIANIDNKFQRGANRVLCVIGADCCGCTKRLVAVEQALGYPRGTLQFVLFQFTNLYHCDEHEAISLSSGSTETLRGIHDAIGKDAARYFFAMYRNARHLNLNLDLAKLQSNDNPVYCVLSAHALVCSVVRQLNQRRLEFDQQAGLGALDLLVQPAELELMTKLAIYPEILQRAALAYEPHQITGYLMDLANSLHSYYNAHKVLVENSELRHARVCLLLAVKQVLANSLTTIGVSTPEVM
jgi:arginyl-tRNA synthetase